MLLNISIHYVINSFSFCFFNKFNFYERKLFIRPETEHIFFFAASTAATYELGTSYLHSFSFNNTILHYQTHAQFITPYSWPGHDILWREKIRSRPPKNIFLTLFTNEALLGQMKMAASRGASPAYVTAVSAHGSR